MKLIVGLGNPGKEYINTRHNVGFYFLDQFAQFLSFTFEKEKFGGLYAEGIWKNEKIILLKPLSYMNLSGTVVKKYVDYYKIRMEDILVVHDDLDLSLGCYRLRAKGSSGGHNGLKDIEKNLQSSCYKRLKIGISKNKNLDIKDYVLGKWTEQEKTIYFELIPVINSILDDFTCLTFDQLMNKYNHKTDN